jgi:hypothetical protein
MSIQADPQYQLAVQAHEAVYAAGYLPNQVDLYSPSLLINGCPSLSLMPSINYRRWTEEQLGRTMAQIGTVFEIKTSHAGLVGEDEWVSYALLRVDAPERWICFALHYRSNENCMLLIQNYLAENNMQVALNPQAVMAPNAPIAFLALNADHSWTTRQ